jgi:hypothetical protein
MQLSNPNEAIVKETLRELAILTTIEHASEVLNSVMATRDKSENEIKELANKIATSIIKRFGRKVLPQNSVQQSSNSLTPLGISLTASSTTPVPKTNTDNPKPKATLNLALLEPGVMLADRYRIIRRVGEGGFSTVFLV